jgi:putative Holliday junction resolvase
MRIMGLDIGDKRIGVALSDPLGLVAQAFEVIERKGERVFGRLKEIVAHFGVQEIVVGLPLREDGSVGPQAEKVLNFAKELETHLGLPIKFWDERYSTQEAEKILLEADQSRLKRKKVKDKLAAAIILQGYLEMRRKNESSRKGLTEHNVGAFNLRPSGLP